MRMYLASWIGLLAIAACSKQEPTAETERGESGDTRAADNTANNKGDERAEALTPPAQQENERDLELTQKIRQGIMASDALSFTAKNSKVIAQNGKVTLRGAVDTDQERAAIGSIAQQTAGAQSVDNQLEVKK